MDYKKLIETKKLALEQMSARFNKDSNKIDIMVCSSTGCKSNCSDQLIKEFNLQIKLKNLKNVTVHPTGCFGLCAEGPIVIVYPSGTFYVKVQVGDVSEIVEKHIINNTPVERLFYKDNNNLPVREKQNINFYKKQLFIARNHNDILNPESIEEYIGINGYFALYDVISNKKPADVIEEIKNSGLRGRGGAGFLTGLKWELTARETAKQKYVVCNADEGDPGAFMDRSIIEGNPHKIIESMAIAAYAVGATKGLVYLRAEYPLAGERLQKAINDAKKWGLLGKNIFGLGFEFNLEIRKGAGAFVCGEETALMKSLEGGRGEPRKRPPYPAQSGVFGCPTVLNNVETWACVTEIILRGSKWFNQIGTEKSKGTKVFALTGKINNTGLIELAMGTSLKEIIYDIGGGIPNGKQFKAVQIGGPSGGCIPNSLIDTNIDYETLASLGAMVGSGGMIVLDEDTNMVEISKFFLEFTCDESCGKCTPCRIGNKRLLEILNKILSGNGELSDLDELETLGNYIKQNSLCGLGQSSPNPVLSTLKYFRNEYVELIENKGKKELYYKIFKEKCVGCSACSLACPVKCIHGKVKTPFEIDQSKCIKCGACFKTCKFNAVEKVEK